MCIIYYVRTPALKGHEFLCNLVHSIYSRTTRHHPALDNVVAAPTVTSTEQWLNRLGELWTQIVANPALGKAAVNAHRRLQSIDASVNSANQTPEAIHQERSR